MLDRRCVHATVTVTAPQCGRQHARRLPIHGHMKDLTHDYARHPTTLTSQEAAGTRVDGRRILKPRNFSESDRSRRDQVADCLIVQFEREHDRAAMEALRRRLIDQVDRQGSLAERLDAADRLIERVQARLSDTLGSTSLLPNPARDDMAARLVTKQCDLLAVLKGYRQVVAERAQGAS